MAEETENSFTEDTKRPWIHFKNKGRLRASKGHWESQVFSYLYLALIAFLLSDSLPPKILVYLFIQRRFKRMRGWMCVCAQDMASSSGWCMNQEQKLCPSQGQRMALTQFLFTLGEWSSPSLCERYCPCGRGSQLGHALLAMPTWNTQETCLIVRIIL